MATLSSSISKLFPPISIKLVGFRPHRRRFTCAVPSHYKVQAASSSSSSKEDFAPHIKKNLRNAAREPRRRLITISTSDGRFHGQWSCDYVFSLRELRLADLAEDGEKDADVFISLTVQKHTGFGFSVAGRIETSFTRKCSCCFLSYCREVILLTIAISKDRQPKGSQKRKILQVIYVQPGSEAELDSLIQDTIRLTASGKDTCSDSCEKSAIIWQYTDGRKGYDKRWSRLLEIKNSM